MTSLRFRPPHLVTCWFEDRIHLAGWEIILGRVLLAVCLWTSLPYFPADFTSQPSAAGLGHWIDFTWLGTPALFHGALVCAKIGLVLYAAGVAVPVGLMAFLFLDISNNTLTSSQGIQGHGGNLNALIALAVLGAHLVRAARRRRWRSLLLADMDSGQAGLRAARWMLAATYVVAGMSKIFHGGWDWWKRSEPFVAQICKAQDEVLSSWAEPRLAQSALDFGRYLVGHPAAAVPMLVTVLALELGAFLACTTRLRALVIGLGLAAFHQMSGWLMGLPFPTNTQMLVVLFIMPLSWLVILARRFPLRLPMEVPPTVPVSPSGRAFAVLGHGSVLSIAFAVFLFFRGEWYPFSHFPMYAVLPPSTYSLFATDFEDRPLPLETLGTDSRALKKMVNSEIRKFKADGTVRAMSQIQPEHWETAAARVVHRIRGTWKSSAIRETAFNLHRKDYDARNDGLLISTVQIGSFPAEGTRTTPAPTAPKETPR
jgi:uncharacterized membrane protein YczE